MDVVPDEFTIKTNRVEVDKETIDPLASLGMSEIPGVVVMDDAPASGGCWDFGGGSWLEVVVVVMMICCDLF
ncbi:putative ribosomal protein S17e [Helianthus annuus]|uniref:Ribosomal protein S17e n=1 Tax=Helianthus annuus TaxID=4232 RepID=A0A9K3N275_HELAN|nr:putative ribosomal protein S17e [Helianthus annuus]KAJ0511240.1 putative ribosomal protein S17e [Helianthus annuus]KAJ0518971.1 putative ribosomal protein S17e [Helianthus annuus]